MAIIFSRQARDSECQMPARQTFGTTHTFTVVQVIVAAVGTELLVGKGNAHFQFRMSGGILLQYFFGIDDACHAQWLQAFLFFCRRGGYLNGRDVQQFANTL